MARIPRLLITGEPTAYHLISRSALDGFTIDDADKDFFVQLLKRFGAIYFTDGRTIPGHACAGSCGRQDGKMEV